MPRLEERARELALVNLGILTARVPGTSTDASDVVTPRDEDERDRLHLLGRAGEALSASLDIDEALARLGDVIVPAVADWFAVDLLEDDTITNVLVMHPDPAKVKLARQLQQRFPSDPNAPTGVPNVIRTGTAELTAAITDEMLRALIDDPQLLGMIRRLRLRCAMVLPLKARGRTIGAITMIGAETHERYGPTDLRVAEEIADRAALAIDTARLFAAEREARAAALAEAHRNEILKDSTAAFGSAASLDEVVRVMLEEGIRRAGAEAGAVGILREHGRVVLAGLTGYQPRDEPYWNEFHLDDPLPMSDAIREHRVIVLSTTPERDRLYPVLAGRGEQRDHALVCVPLMLGSEVVGGFSASYPPGMAFGDEDLSLLRSIGEQCAQAIDRSRARGGALKARARLVALAGTSQALAQTLDLDETIANVLRLTAEHLGTSVRLLRFERNGRVVTEAGGPMVRRADGGPARLPASQIVDVIDHARAHGSSYALVPASIAPGSESADQSLVLPLDIAGSVSGALVIDDPILDLDDPEDLHLAVEVVRRMARALENARLYRERDHVAETLQEALLPPRLPEVPGIEIEAVFRPAERGQIGGDFFDVFATGDGRWAAVIGDVCGKGVEAATLTAMARHTLRAVPDVGHPSEALAALNGALLRADLDGRFCTVAYVLIEPDVGGGARVEVASGGHPLPQHLTKDGSTRRIGAHGTLLGMIQDVRLEDVGLQLESGDALVMFTDGIIPKQESSGEEPEGLLRDLRGRVWRSAAEIRDRVLGFVDGLGPALHDDIAVLIVRAR